MSFVVQSLFLQAFIKRKNTKIKYCKACQSVHPSIRYSIYLNHFKSLLRKFKNKLLMYKDALHSSITIFKGKI